MQIKLLKIFLIMFLLSLFYSSVLLAQTPDSGTETALIVTGILTAFFVIIIFFVIFVLEGNIEPIVTLFHAAWAYVVPQSTEKAIQMDEDFDGITELDNRIPPWFNYLFGATIIFAVVYMISYHVLKTSPLPHDEFSDELASADLMRRVRMASEGEINEDKLVALKDDASLKEGMEKFKKNCVSCHGSEGGGIVGPNLADQHWIHGGSVKNIFATIKNGVPEKGMISWKLVFTPKEIQQIASYILTLQGTNPPGGKPPEGNLWVEPIIEESDSVKIAVKS
ncbi:MAG: cytochrome oxidase subunit III [Chlorobiaceae bacterium]|nr:cytochrome oxidase subunit III [Chlorobiaceae bacterium]